MSLTEVCPADAGGGPATSTAQAHRALGSAALAPGLADLLSDPEALERRLKKDVHKCARPAPGGLVLRFEDMQELARGLADELQVDPAIFGELSQIFWRFDFAGYGLLDEEKGVRVCLAMLRKYRDATRPPAAGAVRLGGGIAYRAVQERYAIGRKLGEGGQGAVFLGEDSQNKREVVLKMYDKSSPNNSMEDITREFELLMNIKHPLIAHVFEIFQDEANIYVVQEPYFGGDLTTAIHKAVDSGVTVNETWLAQVMLQVLKGVAFLHGHDVMHCDLKEPNVMVTGTTDWHRPQVVVIDFGLANEFTTRSHPGGTPGYMPPEVWDQGLWTPKGDVFSIGIMIFSMRTGRNPFVEGCRTLEEVQQKTREHAPQMLRGSQDLQALVLTMVDKSFHSRPPVAVVLEHPFFTASAEEERLDESVLAALARRKEETELKRAVLADLAANQNLAQMRELNELFMELDSNNDGVVGAEEVRLALEGKWPPERIEALVGSLLPSGGELDYEQFMGQLIAATAPAENELLWRAFSEADQSGKGFLDVDDLRALLDRPAVAKVLGDRDPAELLASMSSDGCKQVSFEDFKLAMQGRTRKQDEGQGAVHYYARKMHGWRVGTELEYHSQTLGMWISCKITGIDTVRGAVQLDCKPGYWVQGAELQTRVRRPKVSLLDRVLSFVNPLNWLPSAESLSCVGGR